MEATSGDEESKEPRGQWSDLLPTGTPKLFGGQVALTVEWEPGSPQQMWGSAREVGGDSDRHK